MQTRLRSPYTLSTRPDLAVKKYVQVYQNRYKASSIFNINMPDSDSAKNYPILPTKERKTKELNPISNLINLSVYMVHLHKHIIKEMLGKS